MNNDTLSGGLFKLSRRGKGANATTALTTTSTSSTTTARTRTISYAAIAAKPSSSVAAASTGASVLKKTGRSNKQNGNGGEKSNVNKKLQQQDQAKKKLRHPVSLWAPIPIPSFQPLLPQTNYQELERLEREFFEDDTPLKEKGICGTKSNRNKNDDDKSAVPPLATAAATKTTTASTVTTDGSSSVFLLSSDDDEGGSIFGITANRLTKEKLVNSSKPSSTENNDENDSQRSNNPPGEEGDDIGNAHSRQQNPQKEACDKSRKETLSATCESDRIIKSNCSSKETAVDLKVGLNKRTDLLVESRVSIGESKKDVPDERDCCDEVIITSTNQNRQESSESKDSLDDMVDAIFRSSDINTCSFKEMIKKVEQRLGRPLVKQDRNKAKKRVLQHLEHQPDLQSIHAEVDGIVIKLKTFDNSLSAEDVVIKKLEEEIFGVILHKISREAVSDRLKERKLDEQRKQVDGEDDASAAPLYFGDEEELKDSGDFILPSQELPNDGGYTAPVSGKCDETNCHYILNKDHEGMDSSFSREKIVRQSAMQAVASDGGPAVTSSICVDSFSEGGKRNVSKYCEGPKALDTWSTCTTADPSQSSVRAFSEPPNTDLGKTQVQSFEIDDSFKTSTEQQLQDPISTEIAVDLSVHQSCEDVAKDGAEEKCESKDEKLDNQQGDSFTSHAIKGIDNEDGILVDAKDEAREVINEQALHSLAAREENVSLNDCVDFIVQSCDLATVKLKEVIAAIEKKLGRSLNKSDRRQVKDRALQSIKWKASEGSTTASMTDNPFVPSIPSKSAVDHLLKNIAMKPSTECSMQHSKVIPEARTINLESVRNSANTTNESALVKNTTARKKEKKTSVECSKYFGSKLDEANDSLLMKEKSKVESSAVSLPVQVKVAVKSSKSNTSENSKVVSSAGSDVIALLDDDSDVELVCNTINWKKVVEKKKEEKKKEKENEVKHSKDDSLIGMEAAGGASNTAKRRKTTQRKTNGTAEQEGSAKEPAKRPQCRKRRRAGCQVCTNCPCTFASISGSESALDLAKTDAAVERALIRQLQKLEKTSDRYDEQTDAVRRRLKRHRRDMWKKMEYGKTTVKRTGDSYFLPDLEELEKQEEHEGKGGPLSSLLTERAKCKLASFPPGYQLRLTQMMEISNNGKGANEGVSADSDNEHVGTIAEDNVPRGEVVNDEDRGDFDLRAYDDDLLDNDENDNESVMLEVTRVDAGESKEIGVLSMWETCNVGTFKCPWDQLFEDPCDAAAVDLEKLEALLDGVESERASPAPSSKHQEDEVDVSMLSQRGQQIVDDLIGNISSDPKKLESLNRSCPNWKENIMFAMRQHEVDDIHDALESLNVAKENLRRQQEEILRAFERRLHAYEVFETALEKSMGRFDAPHETSPQGASKRPRSQISLMLSSATTTPPKSPLVFGTALEESMSCVHSPPGTSPRETSQRPLSRISSMLSPATTTPPKSLRVFETILEASICRVDAPPGTSPNSTSKRPLSRISSILSPATTTPPKSPRVFETEDSMSRVEAPPGILPRETSQRPLSRVSSMLSPATTTPPKSPRANLEDAFPYEVVQSPGRFDGNSVSKDERHDQKVEATSFLNRNKLILSSPCRDIAMGGDSFIAANSSQSSPVFA